MVAAAGCAATGMPGGTYRAYVKGVQEELTRHEYDAGSPDGTLGSRTETAIRRYQRDAGLPVDGCASKELLDHLKFHLPKVYARGTSPQATVGLAVQQELARRGYYLGAIDGKVRPHTQSAARAFQRDAGLAVNGVIDQALLERLKTADPIIRAHR
jgi:peptidoglycan hydrolase-like protein with peptidoglycan-binding domain